MNLSLVKTKTLEDHYVVAANKIYIVGAQDGTFPRLGFHIPGEMGGIITQPIRIASGYEARLIIDEKIIKLNGCTSFTVEPEQVIFKYEFEDFNVYRYERCFDNMRMMEVTFKVEGLKNATLEIDFNMQLLGCWTRDLVKKECSKTIVHQRHDSGVVVKNQEEDWYAGVFSTQACESTVVEKENGECLLTFRAVLNSDSEAIVFNIGSSTSTEEALLMTYADIKENEASLKAKQVERLNQVIETTRVNSNIEMFDKTFATLKLNYNSLVQDIEGIGEGFVAGYPDYPWFFGCDSFLGLQGTLATGQHEMSLKTLRLLKEISMRANNENGRIVHEVSPFNIVYNPGNTQETPQFTSTVYQAFLWTGDLNFLQEMYPVCQKGITWLETERKDALMPFPTGEGITEVEGLNTRLLDTAVLTYCAYRDIAKIAAVLKDTSNQAMYEQKANDLKVEIVRYYYVKEKHMFADVVCTKAELESRKEEIIGSCKNTESQRIYIREYLDTLIANATDDEMIPVIMKNWIIIFPLLEDLLDHEEAKLAIQAIQDGDFFNEQGMKLSGMPVAEGERGDDIYAMDLAMSINTGVLAKVFATQGFVDEAWDMIMKMVQTMEQGMPGAISEVLPDQACFMQFWSGYGIHYAFISNILGLEVNAYEKRISVKPNFPQQLTHVNLTNLRIGNHEFNFNFKREGEQIVVESMGDVHGFEIVYK